MGIIWLIGGVVAGALYLSLYSRRGRRAALGSTPMGAYLNATKKGASPEDAIYDAIQVLRYRQPWQGLSDSALRSASRTLGQMKNPKDFIAVVIEVEETRDLSAILDLEALEAFVA